jgi:hypothetical protein
MRLSASRVERAASTGLAFIPALEIEKYGVCRPPKPRKKCSIGSSIEPSKSNSCETSEASLIASQYRSVFEPKV